MTALVEARGLEKTFDRAHQRVPVLAGIDLDIERGEFLAVTGASGSGKSTLLHILGCLETPSAGSYRLDGRDVSRLGDLDRSRIRGERIGFVFQSFHLLPQLTVRENVGLPLRYAERAPLDAEEAIRSALDAVGLAHRADHRPAELSGGEMQRTAIARAVVLRPELILADEPTGNLDSETGARILDLLERLRDDGAALVLVTHDTGVARRAGRRATIRDGRLAD